MRNFVLRMLFYLNQFELHLPESLLKKGFKLFSQKRIKELEKDKLFSVGPLTIQLIIKNNQLKNYSCQCQSGNYCEHLAAALFLIQEQKLGLQTENYVVSEKHKNEKIAVNRFEAIQQIIFKASLVGFTHKNGNGPKFGYFEAFLDLLRSNIKSYHANEPLKQEQIDDLVLVINQASHLISANNQNDLQIDWLLACYVFFQFLQKYRYAGDEKELITLKYSIEKELHRAYEKGLSAKQKRVWLKALCLCLQSNQLIKGKGFYFLAERYIVVCRQQQDKLHIEQLLRKRKYVKPYDEDFDALAVLKVLLQLNMHGIPKKLNIPTDIPLDANYLVAFVDYLFLKNKSDKAFEIIDNVLATVKQYFPAYLRAFTTFAIQKSEQSKSLSHRIKYLSFALLYNQHLHPKDLQTLLTLIPENQKSQYIDQLLDSLQKNKIEEPAEKIIALLQLKKDKSILIDYLIHQKNQFQLLHTHLNAEPQFMTGKITMSYAKQLGQALQRANTYTRQKEILQSCRTLFDQLKEGQLQELLNLLLVETGFESACGKLLIQIFEEISMNQFR